MLGHLARINRFVALMWIAAPLFAGSAFAQSRPNDLQSEVQTLKAENAVVRDLLRKMEEQQKALQDRVDRLQRRLDGVSTAVVQPADIGASSAVGESLANEANPPVSATNAGDASTQQAAVEKQEKEDRYQDGIVIWQNPEGARVPFLLRFNNNTQVRYLNTLDSRDTVSPTFAVSSALASGEGQETRVSPESSSSAPTIVPSRSSPLT